MLAVTAEVHEQAYGATVVGDENVRVAVAVDVAEGCAAAHLDPRERLPHLSDDIPERVVTAIGDEPIGLAQGVGVVRLGPLVDGAHVTVGDEQVQPAVGAGPALASMS